MKTLVIGGHGFVGSSLTQLLLRKGHVAIQISRRDGLDLMEIAPAKAAKNPRTNKR